MPDWDEEALKELNNLDSARLAIRGALATIRDLQDQLIKQKSQVQDEASRRKMAETRMAELNSALERWQEQAKEWETAEKRAAADEERYKASLRIQVRTEERAQIQESQRHLEEDLARLQAELQRMAQVQREKEEGWSEVKRRLEKGELDLVQAEREKGEIALRYRQDMDTVAQLRESRDREIAASIASREAEVAERDRTIAALRRKNEEQKAVLENAAREFELKIVDREEKLKREYLLKEQSLQERYAKREMELQAAWSEVENGLWKRSKDAREKLDSAAAAQFEERARSLADRSAEIEHQLNYRRQELDEDFKRRCTEAEARYAENERALADRWVEKENRFLKKYGEEIAVETERLQTSWQDKLKEADATRAAEALAHVKRREDLEAENRRLKENLLEEAARKEAERIRHQDELISRKLAELDLAHQEKLSALAQKESAIEADAQAREVSRREAFSEERRQAEDEFNRRRAELIDLNAKSLAEARASVDKQYEERTRTLEGAFAAKVAEVDRTLQAAQEQFVDFKARLIADHGLREKNLDSRWAARETELVRRQQTELEGQRHDFEKRINDLQEEFRDRRFKEESDLVRRKDELENHYGGRERELTAEFSRREMDGRKMHDAALSKLRAEYTQDLDARTGNAASELSRLRDDLSAQAAAARKAQLESEHRARAAEDQVREAGVRFQSLWSELQTKEKAWENERLAWERMARERETSLDAKYKQMEETLQSLWAKKEAEAVEGRLRALESQHAHYAEQTAKSEENARRVVEEWRVHQTAEMERQKAAWLSSREKDLESRRKTLESDHDQKVSMLHAEGRKREVELQKSVDEAKAALRLEMDEILREREKAFTARYAALERELAKRWADEHAPHPSTDEPPRQP